MSHVRCRVVVLTFNCADIIAQTLAQARRIDPHPFVVDSFSSDNTAQQVGSDAQWVQRAFKNYGEQRNWAIAQVAPDCEWQLHLDADEVLDDDAVTAINAVLDQGVNASHQAYLLRRVDYFMNRQLRHSGVNPWHLRLFRSGHGACENRLYDQHFVSDRPAGRLKGCMHDKNAVSLSDWTARHNRWSDLEVAELLKGHQASSAGLEAPVSGLLQGRFGGDPRERTRWLKGLYYRLPGGLRSTAYFFYRYVFRLGFLDGREGLYFAFLQALWFRLLVDAKMLEALRAASAQSAPPRSNP
jgi:glycosyltransferase involved in cell wall biosynthesis